MLKPRPTTCILHISSNLHIRKNKQDERDKLPPRLTFNAFAGLLQFRDKPKQQLTNVCARCYKPHDVMDVFFVHGTSIVGNIKEIRDPQVNKRAVITLL